jgi:hypothetical protein
MLIKNFGHLWERQCVYRGWGSIPGHLKGLQTAKSEVVDFKDQTRKLLSSLKLLSFLFWSLA